MVDKAFEHFFEKSTRPIEKTQDLRLITRGRRPRIQGPTSQKLDYNLQHNNRLLTPNLGCG